MRYIHSVLIVLGLAGITPAYGQLRSCACLDLLNHRLAGKVIDYTHNHGADRRIYSAILGQRRDAYVYLPPNYNANTAYPLVLYFHMGFVDEHEFIGSNHLLVLDRMIQDGQFPAAIVVCPDGTICGENRIRDPQSFNLNGVNGRFEDHILYELIPFVTSRYQVRPERGAHAIMGVSAGGLGALSIAIRHRDWFGAVATLAAPANIRYSNVDDSLLENFHPETYRWKTDYNPRQVAAKFYGGLMRSRIGRYIEPVFGSDPRAVVPRVAAVNPADLIFSTNLQPNELAIYLNYGGHDNWNFDAHAESFAWLASQRGIPVTLDRVPFAGHTLSYFRHNHPAAYAWLGQHLLPPVALTAAAPACATCR